MFLAVHVILVSTSGKKADVLVLGLRGYLGVIESVFVKVQKNYCKLYFLASPQQYVRITSSNFRILSETVGGARTSQNKTCSKAGPARMSSVQLLFV